MLLLNTILYVTCVWNQFRLFEVIETYTKYYLIMEHAAAGELFKRLISEGRMHESEAKNIFSQIALAVKHLVRLRFVVNVYLTFFAARYFVYVVYLPIDLTFLSARSQYGAQGHQSGKRVSELQRRCQVGRLWFQHHRLE